MPAPRLLLPALILSALTLASANAHAALPEPTFLAVESATPAGELDPQMDAVGINMAVGGGVLVGWNHRIGTQQSGYNEIHVAYRTAGGTWGPKLDLSVPGNDAGTPDWRALANGDILLAWPENTGSYWDINSTTVHPDGTMDEVQRLSVANHNANGASLAEDDAGNVYLTYTSEDTHIRVRSAETGQWGTDTVIPGSNMASESKVVSQGDGALTVTWTANNTLYASSRPAGGEWTGAEPISATPTQLGMARLASNADGRVVATWIQLQGSWSNTNLSLWSAIRNTDGHWTAPAQLGGAGAFLPAVVAGGNDFVTSWIVQNSGTDAHGYVSALTPSDAGFGQVFHQNPPDEIAATTGLAARPDGSVYTITVHGTDFSNAVPGTIGRSPSGDWGSINNATSDAINPLNGAGVAADDEGNIALVWGSPDGAINVAIGDGAGPAITGLNLPASATVGEAVSASVVTRDRFSALGSTTFDFGDGATAVDADTATYATPGTKTVTVTATDALGKTTTDTGTITVAAAPVPAPPEEMDPPKVDPPKLLAPIIEAKLSGKTITLNARVTLKAGKKCNAKERGVTASTTFGNTTYRTTLKLSVVGGVCRGTALIKLKKSPSVRTKLKVSLGGKAAKVRNLTTKRS